MLRPHCTERVPSCIDSGSGNVVFALHPDPFGNQVCWGSCVVTRNLELVFSRPSYGASRLKIPGAHEKGDTSQFFCFSCVNATKLLGVPIEPKWVMSYDLSSNSYSEEAEMSHANSVLQGLPTVAMLLMTNNAETKLLVVNPVLHVEKKEQIITYRATLLTSPDSVQHVVMCRGGRVVLLLEQCVGGNVASQCFGLLIRDGQPHAPFKSVRLTVPGEFIASMPAQRIICARARRPLSQTTHAMIETVDTEVTTFTDHGVVIVFRIGVSDAEPQRVTCVWVSHLFRRSESQKKLLRPLGVVERWNTTMSFKQATGLAGTKPPLPPLGCEVPQQLQGFKTHSSIVCASSNGALILVAKPNSPDAFIACLGASVHERSSANAGVGVSLPPSLNLCDASWISGPLCGFLLLGNDDGRKVLSLYFLPLTGESPRRVHIEQTDREWANIENRNVRFFSLSTVVNIFGVPQLRISLLFSQHRKRGDTQIEDWSELRTCLFSFPTVASLSSVEDPAHVSTLVYCTGLAAFEAIPWPVGTSAGTKCTDEVHGFGDVQLSTEAALESQLKRWPHLEESGIEFFCGLIHEMIQRLTTSVQRCRFVDSGFGNRAVAALVAVFQGVAEAFVTLGVAYSSTLLKRYLCYVHSILVILRQALTVMGQYGAISACFSAVAPFAHLDSSGSEGELQPEWRALLGALFDEALAHTCAYPSLAQALLPHCSAGVKQIMEAGRRMEQWTHKQQETAATTLTTADRGESTQVRTLQEVLSLVRNGAPALSMLSPADVCCASRRLFFSDGIDTVQAFLKSFVGDYWMNCPDIQAVCKEYETVKEDMDIVLQCR
ncbi:hypothetical protein DPX39_070026000 [Trypanosoma brucei equiperdum]|uniref:Uncharacterized protein n=1 Tax=Trypanosoma brucei equiperdum TaxID=630700 RepID=A0A3L6L4P5_9TRYP|nr:hypothetical protein DPX39_070026000 [Trypanosoma brucei equiperdum]